MDGLQTPDREDRDFRTAIAWRADLPWHPGEDAAERLTAGFADVDGQPHFILTVVRPGQLYRDRARAVSNIPVDHFFDSRLHPGRDLNVNTTHEGEAIMSAPFGGTLKLLAQHLTVATGVHVLRLEDRNGPGDRLILVVTHFVSKGKANGQTVIDMTRDECLRTLEAGPLVTRKRETRI